MFDQGNTVLIDFFLII